MPEPIELLTADQRAEIEFVRRFAVPGGQADTIATRLLAVEAELAAERQANTDLRQAADEADADYRQVKTERDTLRTQLDSIRERRLGAEDSDHKIERWILERDDLAGTVKWLESDLAQARADDADLRDRLRSLLDKPTMVLRADGEWRDVIDPADLEQVLNAQPTQPEQP